MNSKSFCFGAVAALFALAGCAASTADDPSASTDDAVKVKKSAIADREYQSQQADGDCELGWFKSITFSSKGSFGGVVARCTDVTGSPHGSLVTQDEHLVSGTYKLGSYDKQYDETVLTLNYGGHAYLYKVSYGGSGPHDSNFTMFLEAADGVQRDGMDAEDDLNSMTDE